MKGKIKWYSSWLGYILIAVAFFIMFLVLNPGIFSTDNQKTQEKLFNPVQGYFENLTDGTAGAFGAFLSMTVILVLIPYFIGYFIQKRRKK